MDKQFSNKQFDVVISGGGMVGALQAFALAKQQPNMKVAIVEPVSIQSNLSQVHQPSFDNRALALSYGTVQALIEFGVWNHLSQYAQPINDIHVSDRGHIGKTTLNAQALGYAAVGYVIEVCHFGRVLPKLIANLDNVTWFSPDKVCTIKQSQSECLLTLDSGDCLSTSLLLAADGAQSPVRSHLNIESSERDYNQVAVIANIEVQGGHNNRAFERFTPSGPIALLPLTDNRYSLVWCVKPEESEALLTCTEEQFLAKLHKAFGHRAGCFTRTGERFSYPLKLVVAERNTHHRVALLGNASHTIHPIAGQGFNLGMRDIVQMTNLLCTAFAAGQDIGAYAVLKQYASQREKDLARVISMTDSLVTLFSNEHKSLALGRTIGLLSMQFMDCLKLPLAHQAMGLNR